MKVLDVHAHYGRWPFPIASEGTGDILEIMGRYSIEKSVLSSSLAIVYDFTEGNAELAKAIEGVEGLYGYVVVNPNYVEASKGEIDRYMELPKFVGVKIHPAYSGRPLNYRGNFEILDYLAARHEGSAVLLHVWGGRSTLNEASELAKGFPRLRFLWGHMGGTDSWAEAAEMSLEHDNVWLEICSSTFHSDRLPGAVRIAGPGKVVFGSDFTLINPGIMLGSVRELDISDHEMGLILYGNAAGIFGF